MSINHRLAKYLSSLPMEDLEIQKRTLNLGRALVKELKLDPEVDSLACWMAHYIAEQIEIVERTTGIEKKEAEERCFETILNLWKHRSVFPRGVRPLANLDPILRVLARFDPENDRHYFFEDRHDTTKSVPEEVQKWLDVANGIDEAARVWLKYVFRQAITVAIDEATVDWLENSAALQESDDFLVVFRDLYSDSEIWEDDEGVHEIQRNKIISKIEKLEAFAELNLLLLAEYKEKLEKLPNAE